MKAFATLLCGLFALAAATAANPTLVKSELLDLIKTRQTASNVEMTADTLTGDQKTGWFELRKNAAVNFGLYTLHADRVRVNRGSGEIEAAGNVSIESKDSGSWKGDSIAFNYKTGEGLISDGTFRFSAFTVNMRNVKRSPLGVYTAEDLAITSCTNAPSAWHWHVSGAGEYEHEQYVKVTDAVPHFLGVPIGWMPWFYRDFANHYGLRLTPGYTSRWGAYLQSGYVYPIAGNAATPAELYGKTRVDYRTSRGLGAGQELTWRGERYNLSGRLEFYWAHDLDLPDQKLYHNWMSPMHEDRYRVALYNRADLTPRDSIRIHGEYVSDSEFRGDFLERYARRYAQPLNQASYEHRAADTASGLTVSGPLNAFYAGVQRLPEAWVSLMPVTFGIPDLYYDADIRLGWLARQPGKYADAEPQYRYTPGPWADYDTARLDMRQFIRRPFRLMEGVALTPRIGWRGTYYSDSDTPRSDLFRSYFEFGALLSAEAYADYNSLRHTIRPYIDWAWIPKVTGLTEGDNYAFDRADASYEWRDQFGQDGLYAPHEYHGLRLGLRNLLQDRALYTPRSLIDWDLYAACVFQNGYDNWLYTGRDPQPAGETVHEKRDTGWRLLGTRMAWNPSKTLTFNTTFEYDPENNAVALFDFHTRLNLSDFTVYAGYLSRDHDVYDYRWRDHLEDIIAYGGFIHRLSDAWGWSLYTRYNLDRNDLEEVGGFIQYSLDCITFRIVSSYMPSYIASDHTKYDSDFRIGFNVWLRERPSRSHEDWMTWGGMYKEDDMMD